MKTADGGEIGIPFKVGGGPAQRISITWLPGVASCRFRDRILPTGKIDLHRPEVAMMAIEFNEGNFVRVGV